MSVAELKGYTFDISKLMIPMSFRAISVSASLFLPAERHHVPLLWRTPWRWTAPVPPRGAALWCMHPDSGHPYRMNSVSETHSGRETVTSVQTELCAWNTQW